RKTPLRSGAFFWVVIPGWCVSTRPGISRFRARCFASPRNDGLRIDAPRRNILALRELLLERRLQAVELRHQRISDWGALGCRRVDRGVKAADFRLQVHRSRDQLLQ